MLFGIEFYQFVVIAIAIFMVADGIDHYIRGSYGQSFLKLAVRILIWGSMGTIALFPRLTYAIAHFLGVEGNVNAVMFIAFLFVFLLIFKLMSVIERVEQQVTTLTRQHALEDIGKPKSGKTE